MNMEFIRKLPTPKEVKEMYPIDEELAKAKAKNDEEITINLDGVNKTINEDFYKIADASSKMAAVKKAKLLQIGYNICLADRE